MIENIKTNRNAAICHIICLGNVFKILKVFIITAQKYKLQIDFTIHVSVENGDCYYLLFVSLKTINVKKINVKFSGVHSFHSRIELGT